MAIAKNLVEKMGGTISFESEEGLGTTFVILVPFRIDTDRNSKVETGEMDKRQKILIVDDSKFKMTVSCII